jgi:glycosyltransferase involved in cell wall biosynthesis
MVARLVDCYIAVSEANRRYLTETKRLPEKKVVLIYNGCDTARFSPRCQQAEKIRAQLGLAAGDFVLGVVARLESGKGHGVLLQAMAQIRQEVQDVKLIFIGDGSLRPQLESYVRQHGMEEAVRLVGQQKDIENWFALCDATVLPSFYEAFPLTVLESLAAGKPIIASSVGGIPEVIHDLSTGILVPPGDAEALSRAILKIYHNRQWASSLAVNGRRLVEQHFSLDEQLVRTQQLYLRLSRNAVTTAGAESLVSRT